MRGLKVFTLQTDFFTSPEVQSINSQFGLRGEGVVLRALLQVFAKGYYAPIDEVVASIVAMCELKEAFVREVLLACLRCGFFDKTVAMMCKVLTSEAIQAEYFKQAKKNHFNLSAIDFPYLLGKNKSFENKQNLRETFAKQEREEKERKKDKEKSPPITPSKEKEINKEKEEKEVVFSSCERAYVCVGEGFPTLEPNGSQALSLKKENLTKERNTQANKGKSLETETKACRMPRQEKAPVDEKARPDEKQNTGEAFEEQVQALQDLQAELINDQVAFLSILKGANLYQAGDDWGSLEKKANSYFEQFHLHLLANHEENQGKSYQGYRQHFRYWLLTERRREQEKKQWSYPRKAFPKANEAQARNKNINQAWHERPQERQNEISEDELRRMGLMD